MGLIMRSVDAPSASTANVLQPNRMSVWFAPILASGQIGNEFELGDVDDISVDITEEWFERKSARNGPISTVVRAVQENTGTIDMQLVELTGTNLELMFRSSEVVDHNDVAANSVTVKEGSTTRLTGTTATQFATGAQEGNFLGTAFWRDITIISVKSLNGGITYQPTVDYTVVAADEGTEATATITFAGFTTDTGNTITLTEDDGTTVVLTAGTEFATAGSVGALAANVARAISAYSRSFRATSNAGVVTVTHGQRDGSTPAAIVIDGTEIEADTSATSEAFTPGDATTPATIARVATGSIPNGGEVRITYSYLREACGYKLQEGLTLEGTLRIQINGNSGPQGHYQFNKVTLALNGARTFNPTEVSRQGIQATILTPADGNRGNFYLYKRRPAFSIDQSGACV